MPRQYRNVWAAACPTCHAQTDAPCRDLRSSTGLLFGRRTHKERVKAVKAMPVPTPKLAGWYPTNWVGATTTATSAYLTAPDFQRFNGTAITWNTMTPITTTGTTLTYSAQDTVWPQWVNAGHTVGTYNAPVWQHWVEDEEERAARLVRERQAADELQVRREQQARERLARDQLMMENRLVAHARALDLLDELLTDDERALRRRENRVAVRGSDGHLYWIEMHRETVHGNIVRTDEHGCSLGRACVAPRMFDGHEALPTPDGWVGQYLGLKFDAAEFLSHANWSGIRGCVRQTAA